MNTTDESLPELVPCPLCGADKGYTLGEGSTYRWWSVKCAGCGQEVSEARATYPAETVPRTVNADAAWNEAGAHAQGLRVAISALQQGAQSDFPVRKLGPGKAADFDSQAFYERLNDNRKARGFTWKQIGEATGVSRTTLSRMGDGRRPDAASLAALSAWAGINPAKLMKPAAQPAQSQQEPGDLESALHFARSWRDGYLLGGDAEAVAVTLLAEVERMQAAQLAQSQQEPIDLRKIAEQAGISMDCWDMGAASLAHSEGVEGVTRAHLEKFAALYGFACWNAALMANPPNMQGMVDRALAAQPVVAVPDGWQPIEAAPKNGSTMLLGCFNSAGKWRTMRGQWFSQAEIDDSWEEPETGEPGWYETAVEAEDIPNVWLIHPTHWMPLPAAPGKETS